MIISQENIWTSKERSLMTTFRDRMYNTLPNFPRTGSLDILEYLLKLCKISWDWDGDLKDKNVLSMYERLKDFSFHSDSSTEYLIITDRSIKEDKNLLVQAVFHELAHICLEHSPCHGGRIENLDSNIQVMSRILFSLYSECNPCIEKQAHLMTAVFLFFPHDSFIDDLYTHPNQLRYFSQKYNATYDFVAQMFMAHGEHDTHLFKVIDGSRRIFTIKSIPEIHDSNIKSFLEDESRLLSGETALQKSITTKDDAVAVSDSGYGVSFHCDAFYLKDENTIFVFGTDNGRYEERKSLAQKYIQQR